MYLTSDIAYGIAANGVVEEHGTYLVKDILTFIASHKDNLVFYDIGANTGYYGIMASFWGKGKTTTYSFEPLKEFYQCVLQSVALNQFTDHTAFNFALSNKASKQTIYLAGSGTSLESDFVSHDFSGKREIECKVLDHVAKDHQLKKPDFVKIDVEGHEFKVLEGAKSVIESSFPVFYIEIAQTLRNIGRRHYKNESFTETLSFLESFGYEVYLERDGKIEPVDLKHFVVDGVQMYLFLHKEHHKNLLSFLIHHGYSKDSK
ncbi:TPA: hypothetical protein DEP21_02820 [Patescibacteria group bacterium]|nr:hypothetical protein [Candidatus Gracilibacteria bacterium]